MSNDELFHFIATKFSDELRGGGLRRVPYKLDTASYTDSWMSPAARISPGYPQIGIWRGPYLRNERQTYWFGFYASRKVMAKFRDNVTEFYDPIVMNSAAFYSQAGDDKINQLSSRDWLSYEDYEGPNVYFGRFEESFEEEFQTSEVVHKASRFVYDFVKNIFTVSTNESPTHRQELVDARRGQGKFRANLLDFWENACSVSSVDYLDVLRASHIVPWRDSDNDQRRDPSNGLLLTANLDALFDKGRISFNDDGKMLVSASLEPEHAKMLLGSFSGLRKRPSPVQQTYLQCHRRESEIKYGYLRLCSMSDYG